MPCETWSIAYRAAPAPAQTAVVAAGAVGAAVEQGALPTAAGAKSCRTTRSQPSAVRYMKSSPRTWRTPRRCVTRAASRSSSASPAAKETSTFHRIHQYTHTHKHTHKHTRHCNFKGFFSPLFKIKSFPASLSALISRNPAKKTRGGKKFMF